MSDTDLQGLERRWLASGAEEDLDAWLRERIRRGHCAHTFVGFGAVFVGNLGIYDTGACLDCGAALRRTTAYGVEELDEQGDPIHRRPRKVVPFSAQTGLGEPIYVCEEES